jgi:hypothetical protein
MRCSFQISDETWVKCRNCGKRMKSQDPSTCFATCKAPAGWGDKLTAWLAKPHWFAPQGITEASYRALKVKWGFADNCNCPKRRQQINAVGRWVAKWRKRLRKRSHRITGDAFRGVGMTRGPSDETTRETRR